MTTRYRAEKYRFDRVGRVVADTRLTDEAGRPVPKKSSDARLAFKAARLERRAEARVTPGARAMRAVHRAAKPKVTGVTAVAELTDNAASALADFIIADAELRGQA